jgi:hypothetical protein
MNRPQDYNSITSRKMNCLKFGKWLRMIKFTLQLANPCREACIEIAGTLFCISLWSLNLPFLGSWIHSHVIFVTLRIQLLWDKLPQENCFPLPLSKKKCFWNSNAQIVIIPKEQTS